MNYRLILSICSLLLTQSVWASDYEYVLRWLTPNTHTLVIELTVEVGAEGYTDFQVATWRPGRYILQDYAAAVSHFEARRPNSGPLRWEKTTPSTWRVYGEGGKITISYRYFANNQDAGSSYYGDGEVYFNPINCFMYVPQRMDGEVKLWVPELPVDWKSATALYSGEVPGEFLAETWHDFADSPTVFASNIKQLDFSVDGVKFMLHFHGDYQGDAETDKLLLSSTEQIVREQGAVFGGFPFKDYHFIYRLLDRDIFHAVEHNRSSSYALPARVTADPQQIIGGVVNSITSHEFWHAWNVKRIRPAALYPYDYSQPQYTHLHWFTEGVTDYYTHLSLVRAGLQNEEYLWQQLGRTVQSLENGYSAEVVSPAASSFNSWLASSDYAHPDHRISYYSQGRYLGMLMDLKLRGDSNGSLSMDDVFAYLYKEYYQKGQGVPEDGIQKTLEKLSGNSWQQFFDLYVFGLKSPDYAKLLSPFGLELKAAPNDKGGEKLLGITSLQEHTDGLLVRRIRPGTDAYLAGIGQNDILTQVNGEAITKEGFAAACNKLKEGKTIELSVLRAGSPQTISIKYAGLYTPTTYTLGRRKRIKSEQESLLNAWISSKQSN
ncbi:MAG: M61 family metallopeptidase [Bacteroidia bacterium]